MSGPISEVKKIRVKCIPENPFYLRWVNKHGMLDQWCFSINQAHSINISNGSTVRLNFTDYETQTELTELLSKEAVKSIDLVAYDIDLNDVIGLQGLLTSNHVEMLVSNGSPPTWQQVQVKSGDYKLYDSKLRLFTFEVTIVLPQTLIQVK